MKPLIPFKPSCLSAWSGKNGFPGLEQLDMLYKAFCERNHTPMLSFLVSLYDSVLEGQPLKMDFFLCLLLWCQTTGIHGN